MVEEQFRLMLHAHISWYGVLGTLAEKVCELTMLVRYQPIILLWSPTKQIISCWMKSNAWRTTLRLIRFSSDRRKNSLNHVGCTSKALRVQGKAMWLVQLLRSSGVPVWFDMEAGKGCWHAHFKGSKRQESAELQSTALPIFLTRKKAIPLRRARNRCLFDSSSADSNCWSFTRMSLSHTPHVDLIGFVDTVNTTLQHLAFTRVYDVKRQTPFH